MEHNIIYHHDLMKDLYQAYMFMNRTDFVSFAISENVSKEHAILIWQVFDIVEELNG